MRSCKEHGWAGCWGWRDTRQGHLRNQSRGHQRLGRVEHWRTPTASRSPTPSPPRADSQKNLDTRCLPSSSGTPQVLSCAHHVGKQLPAEGWEEGHGTALVRSHAASHYCGRTVHSSSHLHLYTMEFLKLSNLRLKDQQSSYQPKWMNAMGKAAWQWVTDG